jgi:hypothetical protein
MTDDVRKLLGGYATGTLSSEEQQLLFDAALHDDELFAALADEQALKELLDDSGIRAQILRATEEPQFTLAGAFRDWFERPKAKALIATGAVLLCVIGVRSIRDEQPERQVAEVRISRPEQPSSVPQAASAPAPENKPQAAEPLRRQSVPARKFSPPENVVIEQRSANAVVAQAPLPPPPPPPARAAKGVVGGVPAPGPPSFQTVDSFRLADEARPAAAATAAPKAATFERVAGTGVTPLRYELLRKEADGEFRPVPADYEFGTGDVVQVRVTSTRDGAVAITAPGVPVVSGQTAANVPAILPAGGITITDSTNRLVLSFAPPPNASAPSTQGFTAGAAMRAKEAAEPGLTVQIPIRHRK